MFKFVISIYIGLTISEYQIKEGIIPSFLNFTFYNLMDETFPIDISITMSLSKLAGNLLYSIDSKNNQLIISLNDANTPTLDIEINKENNYVSLSQLCGCLKCKYEILRMRIQMRDMIYFQCNDVKMMSYKYQQIQKLNKDYPIPKFNSSDKFQGYLWLVNTPPFDGIYPNSAQLSGCIFEVSYKGQPLIMGKHGVFDKCPITCMKNVCHHGECLETYGNSPVCNCTRSFKNGKYCNDELLMKSRSLKMKLRLQLNVLKVSFSSTPDNIFELKNQYVSLNLLAKKNDLTMNISVYKSYYSTFIINLSKKYQYEKENILILEFNKNVLNTKLRMETSSWSEFRLTLNHDLSKEIFEIIELPSDTGLIDLRYKNDINELKWAQLFNINSKFVTVTEKTKGKFVTVTEKTKEHQPYRITDIVSLVKINTISEFDTLSRNVNIIYKMLWLYLILSMAIIIIIIIGMNLLLRAIRKVKKKDREQAPSGSVPLVTVEKSEFD